MVIETDGIHQVDKIIQQESPVLKETKHAEVTYQADHKQESFLVFIFLSVQRPAHEIIHHRGQPE